MPERYTISGRKLTTILDLCLRRFLAFSFSAFPISRIFSVTPHLNSTVVHSLGLPIPQI